MTPEQIQRIREKAGYGALPAKTAPATDMVSRLRALVPHEEATEETTEPEGGFFAPKPTGESPYETGSPFTSPLIPYGEEKRGAGEVAIGGAVNIPTSIIRLAKGLIDPRTYLNLGRAAAGGIQSIPGISDFYDKFSTEKGRETLAKNRETFDNFVEGLESQYGSWENIKRSIMEDPAGTAFVVRGLMEGASGVAGKAGLPKTAKVLKTTGETVLPVEKVISGTQGLYDMITGKVKPENIDAFITKNFEKGVRPSVSGKGTASQVKAYEDKAITGVKTIVENKGSLKLTDEFGEPTGKVPQTLKQAAQAIEQTKKIIFDKYNTMAKAAGEKGATVDLNPIASELNKIANDPVMQDLHPGMAKYAEVKAKTLTKRGSYTTEQSQQAIKLYNDVLEAFYKNPTYETATRAAIDAMVANELRSGLDASIESSTAPGYQALKKQYGALKTIEKDVVHRAILDARKNAKGLIDFSDFATAAEVVNGFARMDPASFATGGAIKGISWYYKYLNNPNTAIKRLFEGVDRAIGEGKTSPLPTGQTTPLEGQINKSSETTIPLSKNKSSPKSEGAITETMNKEITKDLAQQAMPKEGFYKGGIKGNLDQTKTYVITSALNGKFIGHFVGDENTVRNFVTKQNLSGKDSYQFKLMAS